MVGSAKEDGREKMETKNCSKCMTHKPVDRFSINDFGRPVSRCKDCVNEDVQERSRRKKLEALKNLSHPETDFPSEISDRKCKSIFFYA